MKKIGLIVLLTLSFLLLTNCNKGKNEEVKNEKIKFSEESYSLFEKFATDKKETIEKLKSLNKEEANNLYEEYQAQNNNTLYDIDEASASFLDSIYGDTNGENFTDKDWADANKILNKYDLELWDIGEGMVTIRELPHLYYDVFKDYVTDDYRDYLALVAKEYAEPYFGIEEILVSHEKIADRLLAWEDFQKKYPNSDFASQANIEANVYRRAYILGAYNLHTREGGSENPELYYIPDNILKEFNRFIQENPDSPTVEYINFYLENHKNPNIEEILYDKFEKEIVKDYELENSNEPVIKDTLEVITEEDKESKGE